jgi:hypothetical protein
MRRKRTGAPAFSLFAFQDIITCVMGIMLLLTLMMALNVNLNPGTGMDADMQAAVNMLIDESAGLRSEVSTLETRIADQLAVLQSGAILNSESLTVSRNTLVGEVAAHQTDLARLNELSAGSLERLKEVESEYESRQDDEQVIATLKQQKEQLTKKLKHMRTGQKRIYNAHNSSAKDCWLIEFSSSTIIRVAQMGKVDPPRDFRSVAELITWIDAQKGRDVALILLIKPDAADFMEPLTAKLIELAIPFGFDLLPQDATAIDAPSGVVVE